MNERLISSDDSDHRLLLSVGSIEKKITSYYLSNVNSAITCQNLLSTKAEILKSDWKEDAARNWLLRAQWDSYGWMRPGLFCAELQLKQMPSLGWLEVGMSNKKNRKQNTSMHRPHTTNGIIMQMREYARLLASETANTNTSSSTHHHHLWWWIVHLHHNLFRHRRLVSSLFQTQIDRIAWFQKNDSVSTSSLLIGSAVGEPKL